VNTIKKIIINYSNKKELEIMKLKESVKDVLGVVLFYLVLILGIILLSNQSDLNKKSAAAETTTQNTYVNLIS